MTSQILGSWFSPELRSWFHLGLRRFADADTLHEWTLTSNPLSQSPLAIRHSQELFAQIGKVQKSGLNFDQNGRSKVGLLFDVWQPAWQKESESPPSVPRLFSSIEPTN